MSEHTITEAAARLGISKEAMRSRVQRRRVQARKSDDGQWCVILPDDADASPCPTAAAPSPMANATGAIGYDAPQEPADMRLVEMREEVRFLRERLQVRDDEIAEIRRDHARAEQEWRILLQTAQRQLPAAVPDAPHAPVQSAEHESGASDTQTPHRSVQREIQPLQTARGSWWRRLFGIE